MGTLGYFLNTNMKLILACISLVAAMKQEFSCAGHKTAQFPHPTDCNKYVYCVHGISYVEECKGGPAVSYDELQYNRETQNCDYAKNFTCDAAYLKAGFESCEHKYAGKFSVIANNAYVTCDGTSASTIAATPADKDSNELVDDHIAKAGVDEAKAIHGGGSGKASTTAAP